MDRRFERPAMTKASGSIGTTKSELAKDYSTMWAFKKLLFCIVRRILKYIFLSTAYPILQKSPEAIQGRAMLYKGSYRGL